MMKQYAVYTVTVRDMNGTRNTIEFVQWVNRAQALRQHKTDTQVVMNARENGFIHTDESVVNVVRTIEYRDSSK